MAAHGKENIGVWVMNIAIGKYSDSSSLQRNTLKIAERQVYVAAQESGPGSTKQRKSIDLIEIGDDKTQLMKPRVYVSESEHM